MRGDKVTQPIARASRYCHLCGQRLVGRYYRYETALVVCAVCHTSRPRCVRCSVPLPSDTQESRLCAACAREVPRCACCLEPIFTTWFTFEELLPTPMPRLFCLCCVRERPRCDLCRAPVVGERSVLPDGQMRCARCAVEMVLSDGDAQAIYTLALAAAQRAAGVSLLVVPELALIGRRRMSELRREYRAAVVAPDSSETTGHHILGFFVQEKGTSTIYAEMGLPRALLLGTLAHELGHAWQAERAPRLRDPRLCEGFAEWVAYRTLVAQGYESIAARASQREDIYGQGLRHYLEIERARGGAGVLAATEGRIV
jgi:hypothetical protein